MNDNRPCLRSYLAAAPDQDNPGFFLIWDQLGLTSGPRSFSRREYECLQLFDGKRTLRSVQDDVRPTLNGMPVDLGFLQDLTEKLDRALLLEGPRFRRVVDNPVRESRFAGDCCDDPDLFRRQLAELFVGGGGPGLPRCVEPDGALSAALIPHIDYPRGGRTYAWGYKEVMERSDASLFVIVGTSHHSHNRITLTRRHFRTPLGIVETDQKYIDSLARQFGGGLFDDEWQAHLPEHSIELQVLVLHYLYERKKPIRIVPMVVGSFADCLEKGQTPSSYADIGRMARALQAVEKETGESICYIISGDLAHIGPRFGDRHKVDAPILSVSRNQDQKFLRAAETGCPESLFRFVAQEKDARRVCGFPPAYLALAATQPQRGKTLDYGQYVDADGNESVSFASVAYYR